MILCQQDIDEFVERYSKFVREEFDRDEENSFYEWLANNPQVLVAGGDFQEYVGAHTLPLYKRLVKRKLLIKSRRPAFRTFGGLWFLLSTIRDDPRRDWEGISLELLRHHAQDPKFWAASLEADDLFEECFFDLPGIDKIVHRAHERLIQEAVEPVTFVSPKLWTPEAQSIQKIFLQSSAVAIIRELQAERIELEAVKWQTFEEIVAEILRQRGMEIHLLRERPQGGRDIIARGELVPGMEPLTIAVEVKHRGIVDRPLVQQALYQNKHFPALIFVTSGRFTAGVIKEARSPSNRLRLFLKDGVAIRELIRTYRLS
jgi:hypothetical protein